MDLHFLMPKLEMWNSRGHLYMQWALRHACNFSEGPWKPRIQLHSSASWECRLLVLESSKLYLAVEAKGLPYTYIFKAAVHSLSYLGRAGVLTAAHSSHRQLFLSGTLLRSKFLLAMVLTLHGGFR